MEILNPEKLLVKIVEILEELRIPYYITGGFAVSVWGRPRATFDIDVVIKLFKPEVARLAKTIRTIYKLGYIDEDVAKDAVERKGEFNFIEPETGFKVDFWIEKGTKLDLLRFKRKKAEIIKRQRVYFISPEDLILSKLEWYQKTQSTRQLEDIESILKISGEKLDKNYLEHWAKKLGAVKLLKSVAKAK